MGFIAAWIRCCRPSNKTLLGTCSLPRGKPSSQNPFGDLFAPKGPEPSSQDPFRDLLAPKGPEPASQDPFRDLFAPKGLKPSSQDPFRDLFAPEGPEPSSQDPFRDLLTPAPPQVGWGGGISNVIVFGVTDVRRRIPTSPARFQRTHILPSMHCFPYEHGSSKYILFIKHILSLKHILSVSTCFP
ncbi:hypothetical protein PALA111701_25415 [Paenibacillus lactis]